MIRKDPKTSHRKASSVVGIEADALAVRAVRIMHGGTSGYQIDSVCEERGPFSSDSDLIDGLKRAKDRLNIGPKDRVATVLTGKQIWAGEVAFRPLPLEEMASALKLEVRKSLHFEAIGSTIDYQVLEEAGEGRELSKLLVVAAHQSLIHRQTSLLDKAGMRPSVMEVLPVTVCNALWAQVGNNKGDAPQVALHFGPQVTTVVIDGEKSPFFNRSIYFAAEDIFGKTETLSERDREKRLHLLGEEVARSLTYYEKQAMLQGFGGLVMMGDYANEAGLTSLIRQVTGIKPTFPDLLSRLGYQAPGEPAKLAVSIALALREDA